MIIGNFRERFERQLNLFIRGRSIENPHVNLIDHFPIIGFVFDQFDQFILLIANRTRQIGAADESQHAAQLQFAGPFAFAGTLTNRSPQRGQKTARQFGSTVW